jgi:RNA-binding protein
MNISATVQIGKNGLTESVFDQISTSLEDHELVKIGVLKTADVTAKTVIGEVAAALNAEPVQAIGNKIVLYRRSQKDGIEHIKLD